jgi:bla regulator protein BlaR1
MTDWISAPVASQLVSTSLWGTAFAGGVWLACRFVPALPASARATLWWLVALKLLVGLVWIEPVTLPVLPSATQAAVVPVTPAAAGSPRAAAVTPAAGRVADRSSLSAMGSWQSAVMAVWLAGLCVLAARFLCQWRDTRRLLARATPADAGLQQLALSAASRLGLRRVPALCVSDDIAAPLLVGLRHPRIVVPRARFASLSRAEQRMALGHELAHHRRGDLWFGLVPALAERLFFFHPVARLAAREYLLAREAACDAEVVETLDVSAQDYGRLLLALGVAPVNARFAAAGSSRTFSNMKRRIVMLGLPSPSRKIRTAGWVIAAIAACSLVPVRLVGRAVDARVPPAQGPAGRTTPARAMDAVPPAAAPAAQSGDRAPSGRDRDRDRLEYALMLSEHSTIMSGSISSQDLDRLRGSSPRFLWFRLAGRAYVVRDAAAIDRAEQATRVLREIGEAQGEVGARQGAIGAKQGDVGARQGEIGARQGAIGAKQAALGAEQAALGAREAGASDAQRGEFDRQRAELDEQMRKLDDQMRALDAEMRAADRPMGELDAQMRVLDDEMRVLDRKMRQEEPKVRAELLALFERLVAERLAEAVR